MSLDNGLRHDHTVTCTLVGNPANCSCPYSFWKPRTMPRQRVKVVGTMDEALRLRDHMRRKASGTVYFQTFSPQAFATTTTTMLVATTAPTQHTPTFGEWGQQVMETVWLTHSPRTRQTRMSVYRLYVEPDLAAVDLADVNAPFVANWLAELTRREVSLHMMRHSYDLVRTITGHWYEQAGLPNPVAAVRRPKMIPAQERRAKDCALSAEQYQQVIGACRTTTEELLLRVATEASLRIGELCGLQRRDVDLAARTITVKRQGNRNTTKTGQARTVQIVTDDLAALFEKHFAEMSEAGFDAPDSYIWRGGHSYESPVNKPYERQGVYRIIRRVLARVGLERDTRPHGLRATGAKLLIEAGASLELVSQQLGHATTRTTEDFYVGNVKTDGLARFDQAFGVSR